MYIHDYVNLALEIEQQIKEFLSRNEMYIEDIDLLITGMNGDPASDRVYHDIIDAHFKNAGTVYFKHLTGEYHTASAFALWLASKSIQRQHCPAIATLRSPSGKEIRNILLYNHFRNINHSLILVSKA